MATAKTTKAVTETQTVTIRPERVTLELSKEEAEYLHWLVGHLHICRLTPRGDKLNRQIYRALSNRRSGEGHIWAPKRGVYGSITHDTKGDE